MSDITVAGLRVVHEVARQGSFSGAATVLGFTQSGVSRQVSAMEHAAGTPLFERLPRGVRPTAAGEVLARRAGRVLGELDDALQEVAGVRHRLAGRLVVAAFPTAAAVLLPRAMARLRVRHPELLVDLEELSSPVQLRRLRAGRIEVAVVATGSGLPEMDLSGLRREPLEIRRGSGIAVALRHRLADRDIVAVSDLAGETWIVGSGPPGEPQFGPWPGLFRPRIGYEVRHWATRFGLVAAGLGITLVPGLAADSVPHEVRWLPVQDSTGPSGRTMSVLTATAPSPAARTMVQALQHEAARITAAGASSG